MDIDTFLATRLSARRLRVMLEGLVGLKFAGVNITYPYNKEAVGPLLNELAHSAAAVGAVNLIAVRNDRLIGFNAACRGFARALSRTVGPIAGQRVTLIGAGGVGKAIGVALSQAGAGEIGIIDRMAGKAGGLAKALAHAVAARASADARDPLDGADGIVNATAVGMLPSRDSPIPLALLRPELWVVDAAYQPLWTPLLLASREKGATVMAGANWRSTTRSTPSKFSPARSPVGGRWRRLSITSSADARRRWRE
jgi:shikimate dehydrogenase